MSLDSVDLIVGFERYFNIEIPNTVAEKINTVESAVDGISNLLKISNEGTEFREDILVRLQKAISKLFARTVILHSTDLVCELFPENNTEVWKNISAVLQLEIPSPPGNKGANSVKTKILEMISWIPKFDYERLSFAELTDCICANNYELLIDRHSIKTKYEIYIALMAITVEKTGIDIYEFKPEKTFTDDFGID